MYAPNGNSNIVLYTYDGWKPVEEWDGRKISMPGTFTGQAPTRFCGATTPARFMCVIIMTGMGT
jgi:hypothetical protein